MATYTLNSNARQEIILTRESTKLGITNFQLIAKVLLEEIDNIQTKQMDEDATKIRAKWNLLTDAQKAQILTIVGG